jgi:hypothetical protein
VFSLCRRYREGNSVNRSTINKGPLRHAGKELSFAVFFMLLLLPALNHAVSDQGVVTFTVMPSPLHVAISGPVTVKAGDKFEITAMVTNAGEYRLLNGKVRLIIEQSASGAAGGIVLSGGGWERILGTLQPGSSSKTTWKLKAETPGGYNILAVADATVRDTGSRLVSQAKLEIEVTSKIKAAVDSLMNAVKDVLHWLTATETPSSR